MTDDTRSDNHKLVAIQVGLVVTILVTAYLAPGLVGLLIVPIIAIFLVIQKRTIPKPQPDQRPSRPLMICGVLLFAFLSLYIALLGVCYAFTPSHLTAEQNAGWAIQFVVAVAIMIALLVAFAKNRNRKLPTQKKPSPKPPSDLE